MSSQSSPELTVQALLNLRTDPNAVRLISERLRVQTMGPADHIRTKHEVKAFVESGTSTTAEQLLTRTRERLKLNESTVQKLGERRGERI